MALLLRLGHGLVGSEFITRTAVKAIVTIDGGLLLMLTPSTGDLKFPGGGVEDAESDTAALARELLEETGRRLTGDARHVLTVVEQRHARERAGAVFEMTSRYFRVDVTSPVAAPTLSASETELGLCPVIVPVEDALRANEAARQAPWFAREQRVLRLVADGLLP